MLSKHSDGSFNEISSPVLRWWDCIQLVRSKGEASFRGWCPVPPLSGEATLLTARNSFFQDSQTLIKKQNGKQANTFCQ